MNLIINYNGKDKKKIDLLIKRAFLEMQKIFGIKLKDKIIIFIHNNRKSFNEKLKRETQEWEVANASYSGEIDILHPQSFKKESSHQLNEFEPILKHEFAHLFVDRLSNGGKIPKWLDEGVASFVAQKNTKNKKNNFIHIENGFWRKIDTPKGWHEYANFDAYKTALMFVGFIERKFSFKKIKEIIRNSVGNYSFTSFNKNVKKILGKDLDTLGKEFISVTSGRNIN